jgi:hypothetical protein
MEGVGGEEEEAATGFEKAMSFGEDGFRRGEVFEEPRSRDDIKHIVWERDGLGKAAQTGNGRDAMVEERVKVGVEDDRKPDLVVDGFDQSPPPAAEVEQSSLGPNRVADEPLVNLAAGLPAEVEGAVAVAVFVLAVEGEHVRL